MKKILQKWLGICTHPSWKSKGGFKTLDDGKILIETCSKCGEVRLYRV